MPKKAKIIDPEWQRMVHIKALISHPGWQEFEKEVQGLYDYYDSQILQMCSRRAKEQDLEELNEYISRRDCYRRILDIKNQLLEEFENSPEEEGVKEPQEVN